MIELLIGYGVASLMGTGGTYLVLLVFALIFPKLFRFLYWLLMLPIFTFGFGSIAMIPLGFMIGFSMATFKISCCLGAVFGIVFCKLTDPK